MGNVQTTLPQVVLYEPAYWGPRRTSQRAPLALLAISSLLDKEGYKISIISQTLYSKLETRVIEDCKEAICFGITALTGYQIEDGLRMAKIVRQAYPDLPIVWGGWHATLEPETTIQNPYVDIMLRGQSERAFLELVQALEKGESIEDIQNVSYKKNGQVIHNEQRPLEDINNFPSMPYHLIDVEKVLSNDEFGNRVLNYISSYGCPHRCGFCAEQGVHIGKWSGLSAERMLADFEHLVKTYNVDCIAFNDMQFFLDQDRIRKFCEGLIEKKLNVKWDNVSANIRQLVKWDGEMWDLLYRSGCRNMSVGAESGYEESLRFIKKPLTVAETIPFAQMAAEHNIKATFSMILGLPWDTDYAKTRRLIDDDFKLTLALAEKIMSISNIHRVTLYIYTPYPGTPLFKKALELGVEPPQTLEGWSNWVLGNKTTPWMPSGLAKRTQFISSYLFFLMDPLAYGWVTARVRNPLTRLIFKGVYKAFIPIARFRWKHKFFAAPVDYWIYRMSREMLGIA